MSAIMSDADMKLLSSLKGKTLASVEYEPLDVTAGDTYERVRLATPRLALDVTCCQEPALLYDIMEDVSVLRVARADPGTPFYTCGKSLHLNASVRRYLVGERVTGVEVVREHVVDPEDGESFDMDVTIALRTPHQTVSLSRGIWFDEVIDVRTGLATDANAASVQPIERTTLVDGMTQDDLRVTREVIVL